MDKQKLKDAIFFPVRLIFTHEKVNSWGLTSLKDERINVVIKYSKGKLLDIGCGWGNDIVNKYGDGVGIDAYKWEGIDILGDASLLPIKDKTFDSVSIVGALNHIIDRVNAFNEVNRILKDDGQLLITSVNPIFSYVRHKTAWWDRDQRERKMKKGEAYGLWDSYIKSLFVASGFRIDKHISFVYGLNNLYIAKKNNKGRED
jgi:ubiquinone/menaquinone biosynthesis C-methylase UbiE